MPTLIFIHIQDPPFVTFFASLGSGMCTEDIRHIHVCICGFVTSRNAPAQAAVFSHLISSIFTYVRRGYGTGYVY